MRLTPKMIDSPTDTRNNDEAVANPLRACRTISAKDKGLSQRATTDESRNHEKLNYGTIDCADLTANKSCVPSRWAIFSPGIGAEGRNFCGPPSFIRNL